MFKKKNKYCFRHRKKKVRNLNYTSTPGHIEKYCYRGARIDKPF